MRINQSRSQLSPIRRGAQITIQVNGKPVTAFNGETIAAVLLAESKRIFRYTLKTGEPRGMFCGMGICYDCLVTADGEPNIRACMMTATDGMAIETRSEIEL